MQPTPLTLTSSDMKETGLGLYLRFETKISQELEEKPKPNTVPTPKPQESLVSFLMKKCNHFPQKRSKATNRDNQQYNRIVDFITGKKYGVRAGSVQDFTNFVNDFAKLLWEVDPYYETIRVRGFRFPTEAEIFLGFNKPQTHNHVYKNGKLDTLCVANLVTSLFGYLDRKFMQGNHIKRLKEIIAEVCTALSGYIDYCEGQRIRNQKYRDNEPEDDDVTNFVVTKIKTSTGSDTWRRKFAKVSESLQQCNFFEPIELNRTVEYKSRFQLYKLVKHLKTDGFPFREENNIYHFRIFSKGPHQAVHFIWKEPNGNFENQAEQAKMLSILRKESDKYLRRGTKREIKKKLLCLGNLKPHAAEYVLKEIMGDSSVPLNTTQKEVFERLELAVSSGDDIVVDLRQNNGSKGKFDEFWDIVAKHIEEKTAINDRRHSEVAKDGEIVVNFAMASSFADLYRTCVEIASVSRENIAIPSKSWFMLQFWPTNASKAKLLHHTGRFKVKSMVQARILRKQNVDLHYTNAIFSFMKKHAKRDRENCAFVSADAKCKVQVGEPGYPIAAVARGKRVIVGKNEVFTVGDHDFSKMSLIPDAVLVHDIPETVDDNQKDEVGAWYRGQMYYAIKNMIMEGSSANRGAAELSSVLSHEFDGKLPPRLFAYTDGGGDRRVTYWSVQKGIISLFLHHDLDEAVFARTAAGCSYRNPVERGHATANLGLQSIGLMRKEMPKKHESVIKNLSTNEMLRKACADDAELAAAIKESLDQPKKLIEETF